MDNIESEIIEKLKLLNNTQRSNIVIKIMEMNFNKKDIDSKLITQPEIDEILNLYRDNKF